MTTAKEIIESATGAAAQLGAWAQFRWSSGIWSGPTGSFLSLIMSAARTVQSFRRSLHLFFFSETEAKALPHPIN